MSRSLEKHASRPKSRFRHAERIIKYLDTEIEMSALLLTFTMLAYNNNPFIVPEATVRLSLPSIVTSSTPAVRNESIKSKCILEQY